MSGAEPAITHGRVWRLTLPIVLANVSLPLMGAVDTAVMGHLPDPAYIGGTALGALVFTFVYWGFGFLRMATTGFVAQARGAGQDQELRHIVLRGALVALAVGVAAVALQGPLAGAALAILDGSARVKELAADYIFVRIWGAPFTLLAYVGMGWLFGMQRMRAVMAVAIGQNAVNAAFAILFVAGLGWGIKGVAAATLIAEVSAGLAALALVWRGHRRLGGRWRAPGLFDRAKLAGTFKVNGDIFVRTLCLVAAFSWFTSQGARLGDVTLAANAVLMIFLTVASYSLDGFAHTAEALVGGAIGAGDRGRLREAVRITTLWAGALAFLFAAFYALAGPALIDVLTSIGPVREEARRFLPFAVALPVVAVWCFQFDGIYIGATRSAEMRNGMILSAAAFVALGYALLPLWGAGGLWAAFLAFFLLRGALLWLWYPRIVRSVGA